MPASTLPGSPCPCHRRGSFLAGRGEGRRLGVRGSTSVARSGASTPGGHLAARTCTACAAGSRVRAAAAPPPTPSWWHVCPSRRAFLGMAIAVHPAAAAARRAQRVAAAVAARFRRAAALRPRHRRDLQPCALPRRDARRRLRARAAATLALARWQPATAKLPSRRGGE